MSNAHQSLTQRSFTAAFWSLALQFCGQVINPLFGIILARLLLPDDYGLLGMVGIFWAIGALFSDGGFGIALLQKKEVAEVEYDSVFYYNVFLGVLLYVGMAIAAPWIASFFKQPLLTSIIRVSALSFPIGAIGSIPTVILQKQLDQKQLALNRIIVMVTGGMLAIYMGYHGYGVWALVWQQVVTTLLSTVLLVVAVPWRPTWRFSFNALKGLFKFGSRMFASGLLNCVFDNLYNVVIGKWYPVAELGYYARAKNYSGLFPLSIAGTVSAVTFPAFAQIQDNPERLRSAFRRSLICATAAIALPSVLLCVLSRPLVSLLITDRWLPIVPYMWVLTGVFLLMPLHIINLQLLTARGRSDVFLKLEFIKKGLIILAIVATVRHGVLAMLFGQLASSIFSGWINCEYTRREIQYSVFRQMSDMAPSLFIAAFAGGAALAVNGALEPLSRGLALSAAGLAGLALYLGLNLFVKTTAARIILELLVARHGRLLFLGRLYERVRS